VIVFQSRTGWAAVAVTIIGTLTAADVMPLLSAFLLDAFGAKVAHGIGAALTLAGAITAKLSAPAPASPPPTEGA
jgi:hypothetical protein